MHADPAQRLPACLALIEALDRAGIRETRPMGGRIYPVIPYASLLGDPAPPASSCLRLPIWSPN